jgi:hypothetical protein
MWLYVNSFCLSVCVGTHLVETMSWNVLEVAWKVGLLRPTFHATSNTFHGIVSTRQVPTHTHTHTHIDGMN